MAPEIMVQSEEGYNQSAGEPPCTVAFCLVIVQAPNSCASAFTLLPGRVCCMRQCLQAPARAAGMVGEPKAWQLALHAHTRMHPADIWSFGMVLLELARGKVPLAGCSFTKIILDTVHGDAPSLQTCGCTHRYSKVSALISFDTVFSPPQAPCAQLLHVTLSCTATLM